MTTITRSALVMHRPEQMYQLVNDVVAYPQFLPWCSDAVVLEQSDATQKASITISMARVRQSFTTCNQLVAGQRIEMTLVEGPFSHLTGNWLFKALGDKGCKVQLEVDFDFSNRVIAASVGPVFSSICGSLVDAFCQRADQLFK